VPTIDVRVPERWTSVEISWDEVVKAIGTDGYITEIARLRDENERLRADIEKLRRYHRSDLLRSAMRPEEDSARLSAELHDLAVRATELEEHCERLIQPTELVGRHGWLGTRRRRVWERPWHEEEK